MVLHWQQVGLLPCRKTMMKLLGCHTVDACWIKCLITEYTSDVGVAVVGQKLRGSPLCPLVTSFKLGYGCKIS